MREAYEGLSEAHNTSPDHPYLHALLRDVRREQGPTDAYNVLAEVHSCEPYGWGYLSSEDQAALLSAQLLLVQAVAEDAAARGVLKILPTGDFELLIKDYVCR